MYVCMCVYVCMSLCVCVFVCISEHCLISNDEGYQNFYLNYVERASDYWSAPFEDNSQGTFMGAEACLWSEWVEDNMVRMVRACVRMSVCVCLCVCL